MDRKKFINQSIDYIIQHLDEDLSLDTVAAHFFLSKYHFNRIFKEETGESVYSFIKRCKVDQSAVDMKLNPKKAITDIGLDYGYSSSNYSTVFKKRLHTSPTIFKQSIPVHGELFLQFHYCPCPMLAEVDRLETNTWCQCTTGYSKILFERAFACKADVELLKSIKMGDSICLMKIILHDPVF